VNKVILIGRMNVGKSTLFNRLSDRVKSMVYDYEGVTRDHIKDVVHWNNDSFELIDSAGLNLKPRESLYKEINQKVIDLIHEADVVVLVVDGIAGVVSVDLELANFLRGFNKPVIVAVNKIDANKAKENLLDFYRLGYESVIGISSEHGLAINDLLDAMVSAFPNQKSHQEEKKSFKISFIGKPNVGKSSLMNLLLKQERSLVSDVAGTTREAISEKINFYQECIEITDTPGIRRSSVVTEDLEQLMVKAAFRALKDSDIIILMVDGSEKAFVDQELKLAFYAFKDQHKGLILVINKSDLMDEDNKKDLTEGFDYYNYLIDKIPVIEISCKTGKNVGKLLPLIQKVWSNCSRTFDDSEIARLLIGGLINKPLYHKRNLLKIYKVNQIKTSPVTIKLIVNESAWFGPSQLAYFENLIRSKYDMTGASIKFVLRKKNGNEKG